MAKLTKNRLLAYAALLGSTIAWGLALPVVKKGFAGGLTPTTFLLSRFYLAAIFSLPILFFSRNQPTTKRSLKLSSLVKIILLELLGTVLALFLLYEGVDRTSAIESSLIAASWPILAILGGVIFLHEKEQKHELGGLLLALVGTFILVGRPLLANHLSGSTFIGNLLVIGSNLVNAAYVLLAKKIYRPLNLWAVTHISFWVGALSFTAFSLYQGNSPFNEISSLFPNLYSLISNPYPLISILYMATFGSIIGLTLYLIGQNKIEASEASLFTFIQPVIALPASVLLLSESVQPLEILGLVIILIGVYLAEKR